MPSCFTLQEEKARIALSTIDDELAADPKLAEQVRAGASCAGADGC